MTTKPTLTIGIPAYNEEANINTLLIDLLKQDYREFNLEKIIVASDCSSDNTDEIVGVLSQIEPRIFLISNRERQGVGARQNQIFQCADSELVVLLNADIKIDDDLFIYKLAYPVLQGHDLTSGPLYELPVHSFFEEVLLFGSVYRREVFAAHKNGINIFTCHGTHRAFSKRLYKDIKFPSSVAEDPHSYLFCIKNNFKYYYAKDAIAYIKLPTSLKDHISQSSRFFKIETKLSEQFDNVFVMTHTRWPLMTFASKGLQHFFRQPLHGISYCLISLYIMLRSKFNFSANNDLWVMVKTSKDLRS